VKVFEEGLRTLGRIIPPLWQCLRIVRTYEDHSFEDASLFRGHELKIEYVLTRVT